MKTISLVVHGHLKLNNKSNYHTLETIMQEQHDMHICCDLLTFAQLQALNVDDDKQIVYLLWNGDTNPRKMMVWAAMDELKNILDEYMEALNTMSLDATMEMVWSDCAVASEKDYKQYLFDSGN